MRKKQRRGEGEDAKRMVMTGRAQGLEDGARAGQKGWPLNLVFAIVICSLLLRMPYTSHVLALYLLKSIILTSIQS